MIRPAVEDDVPVVLALVRELATYEREPDAVLATESDFRTALFGPSPRVHASYFLAPASECSDAKAAAPKGLVLVKVDTVSTAVAALKAILAGSDNFPHC